MKDLDIQAARDAFDRVKGGALLPEERQSDALSSIALTTYLIFQSLHDISITFEEIRIILQEIGQKDEYTNT